MSLITRRSSSPNKFFLENSIYFCVDGRQAYNYVVWLATTVIELFSPTRRQWDQGYFQDLIFSLLNKRKIYL